MSRAVKREAQPWLRYLVLPFVLILFGLVVSYALLTQQEQTLRSPQPSQKTTPTPTPTPTPPKPISEYICPSSAWVNCMPILTKEAAKLCTPEALSWYKTNCPDFQGVAY